MNAVLAYVSGDLPVSVIYGISAFVACCLVAGIFIRKAVEYWRNFIVFVVLRVTNKRRTGATLNDEGYFANGLYQYRCSDCANAILTTERITDYFRFPVPSRRITTPPEPWSIRYCWHCGVPFNFIELNPKYFSQP